MSRRLALGLAAAALAWPAGAVAQQTEGELLARLDSLRPILAEVEAELAEQKGRELDEARARAAAARLDTIRVARLRIVTTVEQAETARALFTEVWNEHFRAVDRSPSLEEAWFTFRWSDERVPIYVDENPRDIEMPASASRARVAGQIRAALAATVQFDLSSGRTRVGHWVQGNALQPQDLAGVYRILATAVSTSTRDCLSGSVEACIVSLGLDGEEQRLERWYTGEERRALVIRQPYLGSGRRAAPVWAACAEGGDVGACDLLLREARRDWAPLGGAVRQSLLAYALERGGEGSWGRALDEPERSAASTLARVAGVPLPELVSAWRTRVIENRPETYTRLGTKGGLALVWSLVFAALAMRSTRWRFG